MTNAPAITIDVLPAGFGDCLLITCPSRAGEWRLLIDTGPDETYPALQRRLAKLPAGVDGKRHIDLFIVSHIDHDHIGGASKLLSDRSLALSFGDVWFNAPPKPVTRGVAEGQGLAEILGAGVVDVPWNLAWAGKPVCTPAAGGSVELPGEGAPTITLLSPAPTELHRLFKSWDRQLARLRRKEHDTLRPAPLVARGLETSLEALASRVTAEDRSAPNGSSIALLLEHQGASVLLCADAFSRVMVPALKALAARRGLTVPLAVDAMKLSHHASRANVTKALMRAVQARHFIVSTNNAYFKHPDQEAIARVIVGSDEPKLWFNHDTPRNRSWDAAELKARYGYETAFPARPGEGVVLELKARP